MGRDKKNGTLAFAKESQRILFVNELCGQISDGHWENLNRPHDHWIPWCQCEVIVDPNNVGRDFFAKYDKYRLDDPALLDVVGKRMMVYVRLGLQYGAEASKVLEICFDLDGEWSGVPMYEGECWNKRRAELNKYDLQAVRRTGEDASLYSHQDLKADLKDMKLAMKTRRS